jgi:hypothetical protein
MTDDAFCIMNQEEFEGFPFINHGIYLGQIGQTNP